VDEAPARTIAMHEHVFEQHQALEMQAQLRIADRGCLAQLAPREAHVSTLGAERFRARGELEKLEAPERRQIMQVLNTLIESAQVKRKAKAAA
jgi:hypothetical protein